MPNAIWKGHISFGLVNIPVALYSSADKSSEVSFRQIDRRNNARIKYVRTNVETGKEVPWSEVVRGYEYAKDEILVVPEGALEKIAGENTKTIAIENFVDKKNINFLNVDKVYYLVPDKKGEKGYVILREALASSNKVGIAKVIISTKEYLAALGAYENALVIYTLHYADEIRALDDFDIPSEKTQAYKVKEQEVEIAKKLIQSMTKKWQPTHYQDEYKKAVHKWAENQINHKPMKAMKNRNPKKQSHKMVNFVDLLKQSLAEKKIYSSSKNRKKSPLAAKSVKRSKRPYSPKILSNGTARQATKH